MQKALSVAKVGIDLLTFFSKKMTNVRLQDDLIREFRAEQAFTDAQLALFDPLATQLRRPAARRLLSAGLLLLVEVLFYMLALGGIALFVFRSRLYPFYLLQRFQRPEFETLIGRGNVKNLEILVWCLVGGTVLLCFWLARAVRKIRLKNAVLARTGGVVKGFVGELLQRRAAMATLEQRHYETLPMVHTQSSIANNPGVNTVPNPGYDSGVQFREEE